MDRNTIIGIILIFLLFLVWQQFFVAPEAKKQAEEQKRIQDSIELAAQMRGDSLNAAEPAAQDSVAEEQQPAAVDSVVLDSVNASRLATDYGPFATAAAGAEAFYTLENDVLRLKFSNLGGRIVEAELKNFQKVSEGEDKKEIKSPLILLEDEKNKFEYLLPVTDVPGGVVRTSELYFTASKTKDAITFRANAGNGRYFEQTYSIGPGGSYNLEYDLKMEGLNAVLSNRAQAITLNWVNFLDKLEKNTRYERTYSTAYYKPVDGNYSYCSYTSSDTEDVTDQKIKWVSHSNQFFNSALIAETGFNGALLEAEQLEEDAADLKKLSTELSIPYEGAGSQAFSMDFYIGPNEFKRLRAMGHELEDVIPFGWSIFGTINRWVIRPIFNFLLSFIGSKGIAILALTFFVKLALYPLTYRMLYSQSKMGALKPRIEGLKDKFKEDQQQQQMETMKLYREFGVNPLGGCMPMVLQMPIWFALYRFFPAAIEFRQASFLWATDLSSYDVFVRLPFEIPLGFGSHLSLFTLLWAVTTLIYTYYNTRHMDMSANPAMKYMQYLMPVMFLGFFNSFASGLTCYLLFSNLFNIAQTVITKNYIIDQEKIKAELEAYKKKPKKKKSSFQQRLEEAMKEQQKVQAERQHQQQKKKRNKK